MSSPSRWRRPVWRRRRPPPRGTRHGNGHAHRRRCVRELRSATIPAAVPPTGPAYAEIYRSTWGPGDQAEYPEWHPAVSVQVEAVFAGVRRPLRRGHHRLA